MKFYTTTITAENTFTDAIPLDPREVAAISITGIAGGSVVTLMRRFNPTADWRDVTTYAADAEINYEAGTGIEIRLGIKTGAYGSGSTVIDVKTSGRVM